ncbi:MAG: DUF951 domain-containing protein [Bacillota bacterium]|nr:DUF951 domain-containing protein [Bacillota bacterium]
MPKDIRLNDVVEMKKGHPCGENRWKIIRVGADIKIKCLGCSRIVMIERSKFEKNMKKLLERSEE